MGRLRWFMEGAAHYATMWIGTRYGSRFPMHFVCGFPRSGTTWFSELLADYLNLPRPRHYIFPIGFAAVIHTHVEARSGLNDCFHVVRDGRDSLISSYFFLMRIMLDNNFVHRSRYLRLFGAQLDSNDTKRNLPIYIDHLFSRCKSNWGSHTMGWLNKSREPSSSIVLVRYEDLLKNTCNAFGKALLEKYGSVDMELVEETVARQQFSRQKKRPLEQHRTYLRKGVSGDWRNYFTEECADVFDRYAGQALIELGYEKDHSWVSSSPAEVTV